MKVLGGSASTRVATEASRILRAPLAKVETREFPDGEVYVRLDDDVRGEDVVLVQTTHPNAKLLELLFLAEAASAGGASAVTVVVPYFAYSRQDQAFKAGEVVSARVVAGLIEARADRFLTVDPHKEHILGFFGIEAHAVDPGPEIAARLTKERPDVVLAPDQGALARARAVADALGTPFDFLEKTRLSGTEVALRPKSLAVEGKCVAIVDDIISTGGTIAAAARELKAQGAHRVVAACTHGLFLGNARDRMLAGGLDAVFATDTIESAASEVGVAPAIARTLRGLAQPRGDA